MPELAVDVRGLHKSYGAVEAVRGVDLHVEVGEVFALLGPNGAGKTTTVEILEGHRSRTAGDVSVLGHDPGKGERELRQRIGIVLQETGVEPYLRVEEAIDLYRRYYPHPRPLDEVIEVVGLGHKRRERVKKLSGGQQRRLDVAIGLAGDPDLLFLDEPTTGFDPSARRGAWEMIKNLQSLGKTVFLTTHYMDEAEHLADRAAIIVDGRIVAEGPPSELTMSGRATMSFSLAPGAPELPAGLRSVFSDGGHGHLRGEPDATTRVLHELTTWALEHGLELDDLTITRPTLEDVYLRLTSATGEADPG